MGNATSQKSITIVNESLISEKEALKTTLAPVTPSNDSDFLFSKASKGASGDKRTSETYESREEKLQAALDPFKKMLEKHDESLETSVEKQKLMECLKENPGQSLKCAQDVKNFVNFVNSLPTGYNQQR